MQYKLGFKAQKTSDLLLGLRNASVFSQIEPYGFNAEEFDKGWRLFVDVKERRLARVVAKPVTRSNVFDKLDAFDNHWFVILKAVFTTHYRKAGEELFLNLSREDGKTVAHTVDTFLERLGKMERGEAPFGEEGPEVREYLRSRGLSDEVVAEVTRESERVRTLQEAPEPAPVFDEEGLAHAEKAMWDWYLEWSAIVRQVITNGNVLRMLGFKKKKGGRPRKSGSAEGRGSDPAVPAE